MPAPEPLSFQEIERPLPTGFQEIERPLPTGFQEIERPLPTIEAKSTPEQAEAFIRDLFANDAKPEFDAPLASEVKAHEWASPALRQQLVDQLEAAGIHPMEIISSVGIGLWVLPVASTADDLRAKLNAAGLTIMNVIDDESEPPTAWATIRFEQAKPSYEDLERRNVDLLTAYKLSEDLIETLERKLELMNSLNGAQSNWLRDVVNAELKPRKVEVKTLYHIIGLPEKRKEADQEFADAMNDDWQALDITITESSESWTARVITLSREVAAEPVQPLHRKVEAEETVEVPGVAADAPVSHRIIIDHQSLIPVYASKDAQRISRMNLNAWKDDQNLAIHARMTEIVERNRQTLQGTPVAFLPRITQVQS